jgi:hypothetical protein
VEFPENAKNMKPTVPALLGFLLLARPEALQAQSGSGDGFDYSVNASNANTITITSYTGAGGAVTIPTNINSLLVTGIGMSEIPVFGPSLTSVTISGSVTSIEAEAFLNCINLASVTIPASVTSVGDYAFSECTALTSVTIPGSVTSIGAGPFAECTRLLAITVDAQNSFYRSMNGVLFNESQTTLIQYPGGLGGSYTIPGSVIGLGEAAFYFCARLSSVTIPASVTNLGSYTFAGCTSLTNVTIPGNVTSIGTEAFYFCTNLTSVMMPNSVTNIGDYAFNDCYDLTSVIIPESVTSIGTEAFYFCTNLTSVTIADSVADIGEYAFAYCYSLTSVTIPGSVTNIEEVAFLECASLTSVYFTGNAPSTLGSFVFYGDTNATAYYLPGTTGWGAFDEESGLSPAVLWDPLIQAGGVNFGVQNNQFEFDITGTANIPIMVEASTNLANPVWTPLQSLTLTNGLFHFSDPQWTNYPGRFYRISSP